MAKKAAYRLKKTTQVLKDGKVKTITLSGREYYEKILDEELTNLMDEERKAKELSRKIHPIDWSQKKSVDEIVFNNLKEKAEYANELRIEKYRNYCKIEGHIGSLNDFDHLPLPEKIEFLDSLHPSFVAKIIQHHHPKPKGYTLNTTKTIKQKRVKPVHETRVYKQRDEKTGIETWHQETVVIGHEEVDDNLPESEILPEKTLNKDLPHPVRVKNPLKTGVMYSFRFPLSDGSFMFYTINNDGLYENMQTKDVKSIDQLLRMLNSPPNK